MSPHEGGELVVDEPLARRLASWLRLARYRGHVLLTALGGIALAFEPLGWKVAGGALLLGSVVLDLRSAPKVQSMVEREAHAVARAHVRTEALRKVLGRALDVLVQDLELSPAKTRVSIYRHSEASFFLLVRRSGNPTLRVNGRPSYPDDQGLIGRTWRDGAAKVSRLSRDRETWNATTTRDFDMPLETVRGLQMQALSMIGKRIESPVETQNPVGVLIIEGLEPTGITSKHLDALPTLTSWPLVQNILQEVVHAMDEHDNLAIAAGGELSGTR